MAPQHNRPEARNRNYIFTLNNWTPDERQRIIQTAQTTANIRWLSFGEEVGEEGTSHLQGAISLVNNTTMRAIHKWPGFERTHMEIMRGSFLQAEVYAEKDHTNIFRHGTRPLSPEEKGVLEQDRWKDARAAARDGRYHDIDDEIIMRHPGGIRFVRQHYMESRPVRPLSGDLTTQMYWFYGETRSGKTYEATERCPGKYSKQRNKWWCGYDDQEYVVVEDIDPTMQSWIAAFIKDWMDRVPFMAERKQGNLKIRPPHIICTSQYSIDECFTDPKAAAAIKERCTEIHFIRPMVEWPRNMYDIYGIRMRFNDNGDRIVHNINGINVLWKDTKHYTPELDYTKNRSVCFPGFNEI